MLIKKKTKDILMTKQGTWVYMWCMDLSFDVSIHSTHTHIHPVIILWTIINNNNNNRALRIFLLSSDLLWFFFFVNGLTFRLRIFFFFFLLSFNKNIGTVPRNNKVNYIMFYNILYFFLPTVFFLNFNKFKKRFVFFFVAVAIFIIIF